MRFFFFLVTLVTVGLSLFFPFDTQAQGKSKSYNSLLWEITGKGMSRPSYLFGTMHISNKMVFHLSDSFYAALRNADVVAIELNPEQWQQEIPRLARQSSSYRYYSSVYYTDYLKENSFTEGDFLPLLRRSLRFEPELNDALLYRNESRMDNFQEDTYLDLYIYQTGKKLGKQTTGVETYMEAQQLMVEAMVDASADRDKAQATEGFSADINEELQGAYRRGDLDLLDSLSKLTEYSPAFTEKFLYRRNEIQAEAMDSIMQRHSLFAGVGAAHLPGAQGVIEILRAKGYTLRPVLMQDRDAAQKKLIDSLTVPVVFRRQYSADSFYSVSVPGKLNRVENQDVELEHYADMGNGSYYVITQIKTNTFFNGYSDKKVQQITDSLLYENIPGTILSHKTISRNGYRGTDIINRTKKGDIQHYQLYFTPAGLLIFKMGGKGDYVRGREADTFFRSVTLKEQEPIPPGKTYMPPSGGFAAGFPVMPAVSFRPVAADNLPEWKYEATDPASGDRYAIFRKSIYSFDFIEADTFDLSLVAESFGSAPEWEAERKVKTITWQGRPAKDISFRAKDGAYIRARGLLLGPQYYLLAYRSATANNQSEAFFNSFAHVPFRYPEGTTFTDTSLHFTVRTSVRPVVDDDVARMMAYALDGYAQQQQSAAYRPAPELRYANFISEETGEVILVQHRKYPAYFYVRDSTAFWNNIFYPDSSLVLSHRERLPATAGTQAWLLEWSDTASSRLIRQLVLQQGMELLMAVTMRDRTLPLSSFVDSFYSSFRFSEQVLPGSLFRSKQDLLFRDYYSNDSLQSRKAKLALPYVYYGKEGYPAVLEALRRLDPSATDYYDLKAKLINELGFIRDSTITGELTATLKQLYYAAGDTALFQNSILMALTRLRTGEATRQFKELVLLDPPAFEESDEYAGLFASYADSLKLARLLFPEILNLTSIEDYKNPIRSLLAALADSNYIRPAEYEDFTGNIYFDAKIAVKKMQYAEESTIGQEQRRQTKSRSAFQSQSHYRDNEAIARYALLLAPFYHKNPNLPRLFDKLLTAGNGYVRMSAALALLRNGQPVADSIWRRLAADKELRSGLREGLKQEGQSRLIPAIYRKPEMIAADQLYAYYGSTVDTLVLLDHTPFRQKDEGITTYCFKYKLKQASDWRLALSSVQETAGHPVEAYPELLHLSDKRLAATKAGLDKQVAELMRRLRISKSRSGQEFYTESITGAAYPPTF